MLFLGGPAGRPVPLVLIKEKNAIFAINMEINLFSKCIKDLIVENDRVDVPYLGSFTAEMMPASYSDRQTTIHPPYRKMTFHKGNVSLSDGRLLLDKVRRETGVSLEQAGVELGWCLSRLCSELEGRKRCKLPGLGEMRANARNEFFFVPDDKLDIWPDGLGFEPICIKVAEKTPDPGETAEQAIEQAGEQAGAREPAADFAVSESPARRDPETQNRVEEARPAETPNRVEEARQPRRKKKRLRPWLIVLIAVAALLALFIAAAYLFTEQLSPILDPLLYSKEELELLGR